MSKKQQRKAVMELAPKPPTGDTFEVSRVATGIVVAEISSITLKKMLKWLDDYKKARPSLIAIVDLFMRDNKIADVEQARAIVNYWENRAQ